MTLPRTPPVRRFGLPPPAPRRHHDSRKRLHRLVRGHEEAERPFEPEVAPTWRGSSRDLVANPVPAGFRAPVELFAFSGKRWVSCGRQANVKAAEQKIRNLTSDGWNSETIFRMEPIGTDPNNPSLTPELRLNPGGFHSDLTELVSRYHGKLDTELSVEEMVSDLERAFKEEDTDDALRHADELLEGHGVEALGPVNMNDGPPYLYVNFGDTYDPTIMYSRDDNKIFVAMGGWGDVWSEEGEANLFDEEWDSHIASEFNHELESEAIAVEPPSDDDEPSALQARVLELIESDEPDTKELFQAALYRVQQRGATGRTKYPDFEQHSEGLSVLHMDVVVQEAVHMLVDGWQPKRSLTKNGDSLGEAFERFAATARELSRHMEQERGQDFADGYPFRRSFDELTHEISSWVQAQTGHQGAVAETRERTLRQAFSAFSASAKALDRAIEQSGEDVSREYPFERSFDEVVDDIVGWRQTQMGGSDFAPNGDEARFEAHDGSWMETYPTHRQAVDGLIAHMRRRGATQAELEDAPNRVADRHGEGFEENPGWARMAGPATPQTQKRKQAFHYKAQVKGPAATRFFHEVGSGRSVADDCAEAFSGWAKSDVTLWPGDAAGKYTAKWFDKFADQYRETQLTILEEAAPGLRRNPSEVPTPAEFEEMVRRHLEISDRQIRFREASGGGTLFVDFINLPTGVGGAGGGAEAQNNRLSFLVAWPRGQGAYASDKPVAPGKLRIEMGSSALPREFNMRAKAAAPEAIARYLADFLNKVVREVPPKFTHTRR